jgi:hypothetical protein
LKILHIAPQNFAGMPYDFVCMHKKYGIESRLITMYRNTLNFEEDICLNLPIHTGNKAKKWRDSKLEKSSNNNLKFWKPKNKIESAFFKLRDIKNKKIIDEYITKYDLKNYDVIHFDGGMDFYRDVSFALKLKEAGKKIICCYFGSDLRSRGIFEKLNDISDLNLTVEYDHLGLHPNINYIFFPFDTEKYSLRINNNKVLKIIHSPTNRLFKGTDKILKVIEEVKKEIKIDFVLAENIDRKDLLAIKSECDLSIDQVGGLFGGTGYGKNSIENLSIGLPTITEFTDDYLKFIGDNPFIHSLIDDLKSKIIHFNKNRDELKTLATEGRDWVEKFHSFDSVNKSLNKLYDKYGILN